MCTMCWQPPSAAWQRQQYRGPPVPEWEADAVAALDNPLMSGGLDHALLRHDATDRSVAASALLDTTREAMTGLLSEPDAKLVLDQSLQLYTASQAADVTIADRGTTGTYGAHTDFFSALLQSGDAPPTCKAATLLAQLDAMASSPGSASDAPTWLHTLRVCALAAALKHGVQWRTLVPMLDSIVDGEPRDWPPELRAAHDAVERVVAVATGKAKVRMCVPCLWTSKLHGCCATITLTRSGVVDLAGNRHDPASALPVAICPLQERPRGRCKRCCPKTQNCS